ncbi:NTP transferase domain-containing protein [Candidatus Riflebacteria bacterium]
MDQKKESYGLIILCAGKSERMGQVKQLLPYAGKTVLHHLLSSLPLELFAEVFFITGYHHDCFLPIIEEYCEKKEIKVYRNYAHKDGQFESIRVGLRAAMVCGASGVFVALSDMPLITKETFETLIKQAEKSTALFLLPVYKKKRGHPVFFKKQLFQEILAYDGKDGLRGFFRSYTEKGDFIAVNDPGILKDLDRPGDLKYLLQSQP